METFKLHPEWIDNRLRIFFGKSQPMANRFAVYMESIFVFYILPNSSHGLLTEWELYPPWAYYL